MVVTIGTGCPGWSGLVAMAAVGRRWPLLDTFPVTLWATVVATTQQRYRLAQDADVMPDVWRQDPSKHLFSLFFFHLPAFITAVVRVVVLCFSLKIRNTSLLFTP